MTMRTFIKYVLNTIITIAIAFVLITGYKTIDPLDKGYETQDFFGFQIYQIGSDSMFPTLKTGDVVFTKLTKGDTSDIIPGDIVAYKLGESVIVHRVEEITPEGNFITKGDSNNMSDGEISKDSIIAKNIFTVPRFGIFIEKMRKPAVFLAFSILIISLVIFIENILKITDSYFKYKSLE